MLFIFCYSTIIQSLLPAQCKKVIISHNTKYNEDINYYFLVSSVEFLTLHYFLTVKVKLTLDIVQWSQKLIQRGLFLSEIFIYNFDTLLLHDLSINLSLSQIITFGQSHKNNYLFTFLIF